MPVDAAHLFYYAVGIAAIVAVAITALGKRQTAVSDLEQRAAKAWESQAEALTAKVTELEKQHDIDRIRIDKLEIENQALTKTLQGMPAISQFMELIATQHRELMTMLSRHDQAVLEILGARQT